MSCAWIDCNSPLLVLQTRGVSPSSVFYVGSCRLAGDHKIVGSNSDYEPRLFTRRPSFSLCIDSEIIARLYAQWDASYPR